MLSVPDLKGRDTRSKKGRIVAEKSIDRLRLAVGRGVKRRRKLLLDRVAEGRLSLPESVLKTLESADANRTDFDAVTELLDSEAVDERIAAALCIEQLANAWHEQEGPWARAKATRPRLKAALNDELPKVQRRILCAVAKLPFGRDEDVLPVLVKKLQDPNEEIQESALRAIRSYGVDLASQFVNEIAILLESPYSRLQIEACRTLASFGDEAVEAIPPLLNCLRGAGTPGVRSEVLKALMAIDPHVTALARLPNMELRDLLTAELRRLGTTARGFRQSLQEAWSRTDADDAPVWYTTKELAELFDVEVRTIGRWLANGELQPESHRRGACLFAPSTIERLVRERRKD